MCFSMINFLLPTTLKKFVFLNFPALYFTGQQQHFRPFFDARFTGHLMDLRRKSDPFLNPQGKQIFLPFF